MHACTHAWANESPHASVYRCRCVQALGQEHGDGRVACREPGSSSSSGGSEAEADSDSEAGGRRAYSSGGDSERGGGKGPERMVDHLQVLAELLDDIGEPHTCYTCYVSPVTWMDRA